MCFANSSAENLSVSSNISWDVGRLCGLPGTLNSVKGTGPWRSSASRKSVVMKRDSDLPMCMALGEAPNVRTIINLGQWKALKSHRAWFGDLGLSWGSLKGKWSEAVAVSGPSMICPEPATLQGSCCRKLPFLSLHRHHTKELSFQKLWGGMLKITSLSEFPVNGHWNKIKSQRVDLPASLTNFLLLKGRGFTTSSLCWWKCY